MEREREETNSSHYAASRISLWCPICGAAEGKGCTIVKGLRFSGHNGYAAGTIFRAPEPIITGQFESLPVHRGNTKARVN